jgi:N-acyl amino acid synthase of PEP-CTERM/exosortase system
MSNALVQDIDLRTEKVAEKIILSYPTTRDEKEICYGIRHEVYVEEEGWEPASLNGLECNRFDDRAVHILVRDRESGEGLGTARIVLPASSADPDLPWCGMFPEWKRILTAWGKTCEVSRLAVPRRVMRSHHIDKEVKRFILPCLIKGIINAAQRRQLRSTVLLAEEWLLHRLALFGIKFDVVGVPVEHHGIRVPCHRDVEKIVRGMNPWIRELVEE